MDPSKFIALHRLARAAMDLGQYNAAKLLAAAATSLVNRQLYSETLPKTDAALAAEVAALEPALQDAGLSASLLGALRQARAALTEGRLVVLSDAPRVSVCRACGEAVLGETPDHCPHCGAGRLTFQELTATYYLEPEPAPVVLDQLATTPDWLEQTVAELTEEQAARNVAGVEGEWSLREAAGHLLDAQDLIARRVNLFREQEAPDLAAKAVSEMVESAKRPVGEIAAAFRRSRESMLADLRQVPPAHWERVGRHTEFGPVTLRQQATYFAKHEQWHMAQMTRIRRALASPG